jgi:hypothetical protein
MNRLDYILASPEAATMRAWAEEAAKAENANAEDLEAARDTIQRLTDLVRYQRGPLHDTGLISDEEYADLAGDHAAVARLKGHDALRAALTAAQAEASLLQQEAHIHRVIGDKLVAEVEHLRAQVAELQALGVSLHKAADVGAQAERAAVVAWIRIEESHYPVGHAPLNTADAIERGEHRREEEK